MKGKTKVYHANLLKKYLEQDVASAAINQKIGLETEAEDDEPATDPGCDEDLVEIGGYTAKESIDDVTLAPHLTEAQKSEFINCSVRLRHGSSLFILDDARGRWLFVAMRKTWRPFVEQLTKRTVV